MKIGYPCINLSLSEKSNRTFRVASYSHKKAEEIIHSNLCGLEKIIDFNIAHDLLFFRITSDLIPLASHPIMDFNWQKNFKSLFQKIGKKIKKANMRISMHPGQYTLINSPREDVVENAKKELLYHAQVLDLLELNETAKIQIHVGGVYDDKQQAIARFIKNFASLDASIKRRLCIENDERCYNLKDCLALSQQCNIPIIFDVLHHRCFNNGETLKEGLQQASQTWHKKDGIIMVDYSSQAIGERIGKHSFSLDQKDFLIFLNDAKIVDCDIMLEIKDKEKSALLAKKIISL